jgi:hypothetical protein
LGEIFCGDTQVFDGFVNIVVIAAHHGLDARE